MHFIPLIFNNKNLNLQLSTIACSHALDLQA